MTAPPTIYIVDDLTRSQSAHREADHAHILALAAKLAIMAHGAYAYRARHLPATESGLPSGWIIFIVFADMTGEGNRKQFSWFVRDEFLPLFEWLTVLPNDRDEGKVARQLDRIRRFVRA